MTIFDTKKQKMDRNLIWQSKNGSYVAISIWKKRFNQVFATVKIHWFVRRWRRRRKKKNWKKCARSDIFTHLLSKGIVFPNSYRVNTNTMGDIWKDQPNQQLFTYLLRLVVKHICRVFAVWKSENKKVDANKMKSYKYLFSYVYAFYCVASMRRKVLVTWKQNSPFQTLFRCPWFVRMETENVIYFMNS